MDTQSRDRQQVARKDSLLKAREKLQLLSRRGYRKLGCPVTEAKACVFILVFLPGMGSAKICLCLLLRCLSDLLCCLAWGQPFEMPLEMASLSWGMTDVYVL